MNVKEGYDSPDGVSARARGFALMIEKFADRVSSNTSTSLMELTTVSQLPNMDFPINAMAEGRILVPWEHRQYPNLTEGENSCGLERFDAC